MAQTAWPNPGSRPRGHLRTSRSRLLHRRGRSTPRPYTNGIFLCCRPVANPWGHRPAGLSCCKPDRIPRLCWEIWPEPRRPCGRNGEFLRLNRFVDRNSLRLPRCKAHTRRSRKDLSPAPGFTALPSLARRSSRLQDNLGTKRFGGVEGPNRPQVVDSIG